MITHLLNYRLGGDPAVHCGAAQGDRLYPINGLVPGAQWASLQQAYENWSSLESLLDQDLTGAVDSMALSAVQLLPPSLYPSAIFFAGFNYRDHVANMMKVFDLPDDPDPKSVGLSPWHGLKPRNTLCSAGSTVKLPTPRTDWEIELAVVIGRPARNVSVAAALDHVAGYTVGVDLSARDRAFRPHTPVDSVARMDWIAQKGFEGACPLGPWLTPSRFISDPQALDLRLTVNGEVKQDSSTQQMIFTVAESVAHLSSILLLSPGDIILTGTPAGTGAERGEALKPGDLLSATIAEIGELRVHFS